MKIYPYKADSAGAKALADALDIKRFNQRGNTIQETILNWGSSHVKRKVDFLCAIINHPVNVKIAGNKLETFKHLHGRVGIPEWTERADEAMRWLAEDSTVVCRQLLTGHSGKGIVIAQGTGDLVEAPLYTKYVKKKEEYRCHVAFGNVIFLQRKARKLDVPDDQVNWQVRNLDGGFIYAAENVEIPEEAKAQCVCAVGSLGLDFGAVDIVLGRDNGWYTLEVNTAPGIQGRCLDAYVRAFKGLL